MGLLRAGMHVHLVGIGGIGLSAIARVLRGWGYRVSGSDRQRSALSDSLEAEGITVYTEHRARNVAGADILVVSSAIPDDNPELREAERLGVPAVKRERFLAELTAGKTTIAVAGTHGKTTTSALIAWILLHAELDPTFIVGGVLLNLGTNARAGLGAHMVIEADEYDRAFLGLSPAVAVVTTLEHDHPDCYPTFDEMQAAFATFAGQIVPDGLLIAGDDPPVRRLAGQRQAQGGRVVGYGLGADEDWQARDVGLGPETRFSAWHAGHRLGECSLRLAGKHNVLNALAALAAAAELGVSFEATAEALADFQGTGRRFEIKGEVQGITVVDDYAHHPTAIRATLAAARARYPGRPIWAVFQPHTYSRTAALLEELGGAFAAAEHVIVMAVYAAREPHAAGVSGAVVTERIRRQGHPDARYAATPDEAAALLEAQVRPGDVVMTLSAGDGYLIGESLLRELRG